MTIPTRGIAQTNRLRLVVALVLAAGVAVLGILARPHPPALSQRGITRGGEGLSVPFNEGFWGFSFLSKTPYVFISLLFLVVATGVAAYIARSKLGYQLTAIREDQDAAQALGINTTRAKLTAAAASGALTAMCGTFYAQYIFYISPASVFAGNTSFQPLLLTIIGGIGTIAGPVLGALTIIPLTQLILGELGDALPGLHTLVYGIALILIVLFAPGGLGDAIGVLRNALKRTFTTLRAQPTPPPAVEQKGVK